MFKPSPMQKESAGQPHVPPQPSPPHQLVGQLGTQLFGRPVLFWQVVPVPQAPQLSGSQSKEVQSIAPSTHK